MKFELNEKEQKSVSEALDTCKHYLALKGVFNQDIDYFFKIGKNTGLGRAVTLVIHEHSIEKDITDYSNW